MESATKNKQTEASLNAMIQQAFGGIPAVSVKELKEGFFNAAYLVQLEGGQEFVLKIAPSPDRIIMTHEKDIMRSEVEAMRLVAASTDVPAATILFYDDSRTVCEADYFFMEKLPGASYHSLMNELSEAGKEKIDEQVGRLTSRINGITGERFGYFGQPDRQGTVWFDVFRSIVQDAISDAQVMNIDLGLAPGQLIELLDQDRLYFDEVIVPKLVHWDLWAGNVFVLQEQVTGVIDFERCLWADELMEVGFRSYAINERFLEGYGMAELTLNQRVRARWYDMYVFLIAALECDYRHYEDRGAYNWATQMIRETHEWLTTHGN